MSKSRAQRKAEAAKANAAQSVQVLKDDPALPLAVRQQRAIDGFANFVSKVGVNADGNNQLSQSTYVFNLVTRNRIQLEAMYRGSWTAGKVVDTVAEDMTRAGITITSTEASERINDLQAGISKLRIWDSIRDLTKWGRLYGGAIGVLLVEGQDLSTPLDVSRIGRGQFKGIRVFDRWQVNPDLGRLIKVGPGAGLPAYYTLVVTSTDVPIDTETINEMKDSFGYVDGQYIHHSRIIRNVGIELPYFQALTEQLWGESYLERLYDRIVAFDNATMSMANLINHANLTNIGIENLREILSAGGKAREGLEAMFQMMQYMRSNEGLTLVDKNDQVNSNSYTFSGLADVMLQLGQQLAGASRIPLVKFFAQSPAGLNATGDSDIRNYYDDINAQQEEAYRPGIEKILHVLHKSLFGIPAPKDMQFTFTALWQMSAKEKAEVGKSNTETIAGAFSGGLVSRAIALKELKNQSAHTGLWTSITDEDIAEAEKDEQFEEPPAPGNTEENPNLPAQDSGAIVKILKKLRLRK